jgi:hypothetical protein
MKWKHFVLPLVLLAVCPLPAQDIEKRQREGIAFARLIAAHQLPVVTHGQCFSAQGNWLERDKADKQNGPYWFQKVSTEELARMASFSTACATEGREGHANPNATSVAAFVARSREFQNIQLNRAEAVLHDHSLIEEYLLQP